MPDSLAEQIANIGGREGRLFGEVGDLLGRWEPLTISGDRHGTWFVVSWLDGAVYKIAEVALVARECER